MAVPPSNRAGEGHTAGVELHTDTDQGISSLAGSPQVFGLWPPAGSTAGPLSVRKARFAWLHDVGRQGGGQRPPRKGRGDQAIMQNRAQCSASWPSITMAVCRWCMRRLRPSPALWRWRLLVRQALRLGFKRRLWAHLGHLLRMIKARGRQ